MSLRASQTARPAACPESRLDLALRVGQHRLEKTVSHAQIGELAGLLLRLKTEDVDGTGKRKVDGSLAATERWCNERFRQVMLLILEFRLEWPDNSLLTADDVERTRGALDGALYVASSENHVGDIYDLNPTLWSILLVQWAHCYKVGGRWTVETAEAQRRLTFENLYRWLDGRHSLRIRHDLRDPTTKKVVSRYVLPFKKQKVPVDASIMFKIRKGARRLSDWIVRGSGSVLEGFAAGIIDMKPAEIVAPPPNAAAREARANTAWERARAAQLRRSRLRSVVGDSEDAEETRQVDS
jgi:hypothetical protein